MVSVPAGLLTILFLENVNKFQNPFRHPVATTVFLLLWPLTFYSFKLFLIVLSSESLSFKRDPRSFMYPLFI